VKVRWIVRWPSPRDPVNFQYLTLIEQPSGRPRRDMGERPLLFETKDEAQKAADSVLTHYPHTWRGVGHITKVKARRLP
jgi:hypothetical protein